MRIHTFPLFAMSLPTTAGAVGAPGAGHLGVLDFDPVRDAQAMNLAQFTTSFIAMGLPGGSGNVPTLSPLFAGADFLTASPEGGLHLPGLPDAPVRTPPHSMRCRSSHLPRWSLGLGVPTLAPTREAVSMLLSMRPFRRTITRSSIEGRAQTGAKVRHEVSSSHDKNITAHSNFPLPSETQKE